MIEPRHRGDCADFFATPKQSEWIGLRIPPDLLSELEHEASRAGRTWNDHLCYILNILHGSDTPDFDDARTVEDWRTRMSPCLLQFNEGEEWVPLTVLRRQTS